MPTISYTFVDRCAGGGHTRFDISVGGGPVRRRVFTTDDILPALSELTLDEREAAELLILKIHMAGKTRAQIVTELQAGPVMVTI